VTGGEAPAAERRGALSVLRNRPFLLLWLSQVATQIGGNMVLYGLTVLVLQATSSNAAISALFLTFLVPAVLLSAVAGVYVDRLDRRVILLLTNLIRAVAFVAIYLVGDNLGLILLLNVFVSVVTVFFAPAEAAMIPTLVQREQLVAANGLFTLTLNGAFALGFALLGPLIVTLFGPERLILTVAVLYLIAAAFCFTLPSSPPARGAAPGSRAAVGEAETAVVRTFQAMREGIVYIRAHPSISWSLVYLGIAASLVGVIGVLGPSFAQSTLGLDPKDLIVVVLPLGLGIVFGILLLNNYGHFVVRRRAIEGGLIMLGLLLVLLTIAGPISRAVNAVDRANQIENLSGLTTLVAVVVVIAFFAGIAYGVVAISSQVQLQEDIPEDVRGRVFGVLNMLISIASFVPIIIVGPIADLVGTTAVILGVAALVLVAGIASVVLRGGVAPAEAAETAGRMVGGRAMDAIGVTVRPADEDSELGVVDGPATRDEPAASGEPAPSGEPSPSRPNATDDPKPTDEPPPSDEPIVTEEGRPAKGPDRT
jgi:MFS family permease